MTTPRAGRRSALLLSVEFVVDGLGRVFRTHRQQDRAPAAPSTPAWQITVIVTPGSIAVARLAILALVVAITSRRLPLSLGGEDLPPPSTVDPSRTWPNTHAQLELDSMDALDEDQRPR